MKKTVYFLISLLLTLALPFAFALESGSVDLKELAGEWEGWGSIARDIHLTFTINQDGLGECTFEEIGIRAGFPFQLIAEDHSFVAGAFLDNDLGITDCKGTWQYQNGLMALDMVTLYKNGRQREDYFLCQRTDKNGIENGPNSLEAKLGKCLDADYRFVLPGSITWDSTPADATALIGEPYIQRSQSTVDENVFFLASRRAAPWEQGIIITVYGFRNEEMVLVAQEIQKKAGANEGFYDELCTVLSSMYGKPNFTDFEQIFQYLAALDIPSEFMAQLEATPWRAWMLPDRTTLAFAMNFQGNGVLYFNTVRLLK